MAKLKDKPKDFTLKENTAIQVVNSNPRNKIEVEIGDSKDPDFKPQYKIMRWDNEVNFSMRAEEDATATTEVVGDVVKYKAKDYEVHQYEKPEVGEDGGFEFEWVLPKKPTTNVLTATIQTKGLDFFYQPELTQQEIDDGAERPENVVGSYAVYHKTKRDNRFEEDKRITGADLAQGLSEGWVKQDKGKTYVLNQDIKTGKVFHIYRPKAIDNNGVETWCELNIDEVQGKLTVTTPQDFLDNATYPVRVDPTFGYTTVGGTSAGWGANIWRASGSVVASNGIVDSISWYWPGSGAPNLKGVITDISGNILTNGVSPSVLGTGGAGWKTASYITKPSVTATTTFAGGIMDTASSGTSVYDITSADGTNARDITNSYSSPTNPTDADFLRTTAFSIYATYTESATRRVFNIS